MSLTTLLSIHNLPIPLHRRLRTAREQLAGMLNAGELDALDPDARYQLRGIEIFLLGAADEAQDANL